MFFGRSIFFKIRTYGEFAGLAGAFGLVGWIFFDGRGYLEYTTAFIEAISKLILAYAGHFLA